MSNISVSITENGTTTLATAGKYCDKNVDVVVNVAGGGGDDEVATLTGSLDSLFDSNRYSDFLNKYTANVVATNVTNFTKFCYSTYDLVRLPITSITVKETLTSFSNMFYSCNCLIEVPPIAYTYLTNSGSTSLSATFQFYGCYSLRSIPENYFRFPMFGNNSRFFNCYILEEIPQITIPNVTSTTNVFYNAFANCHRLSSLKIGGSLKGLSNQTIDLTTSVGYTNYPENILNRSDYHGITAATQVTNDATYQALKNNPDWWTSDIAYSRYNHDSAAETLANLPFMTAGKGNTIKFRGASGSSTDGGAINTLTAAELAVASSRNWTVTLV